MKALVVGGTGPTGPYTVEGLLKRGHEVTICHRGTHEVEFSKPIEHLHLDPNFAEPLAQGFKGRKWDVALVMYGRLRLVAEALKGKTSQLIAIGGIPYKMLIDGEKGMEVVRPFIPEGAPLWTSEAHKFTYLMVKSEETVMKAHAEGAYSATILRYPWVFGPRQLAPREWSIIRRILDKRRHIIIPNNGLKLERKIFAENAAHATLLAVDKPKVSAGKIYNVGDDDLWTQKEWIIAISQIMGHEWELVSLPFSLARPTRPYTGRDFHWVIDTTKIKAELGYKDLVSKQEAIKRAVNWLLENRPEPGGDIESRLGDPFNYSVEDELIDTYRQMEEDVRKKAYVGFKWWHPYDHPKTEDEDTTMKDSKRPHGVA